VRYVRSAFITDTLVLTAEALPITRRSEDLFTEKTILFRTVRAIVNGFRLCDLTMTSAEYRISACKTDRDTGEVLERRIHRKHVCHNIPFI
jgi:hypothetical protein